MIGRSDQGLERGVEPLYLRVRGQLLDDMANGPDETLYYNSNAPIQQLVVNFQRRHPSCTGRFDTFETLGPSDGFELGGAEQAGIRRASIRIGGIAFRNAPEIEPDVLQRTPRLARF